MNSCLYECTVGHDRKHPKAYRFKHNVFMFYLDLEDLDHLSNLSWLMGTEAYRIYRFSWDDHVPQLREYLRAQGVADRVKRVKLLTNLRTFGYVFNPVSFYFCFDEQDKPVCSIAEIGNTYGELKRFFFNEQHFQEKWFKDQRVKFYYISPFTDLDNALDFKIEVPGNVFRIDIDVLKNHERFFYSYISGAQKDLNTWNLLWATLKFPFVTLKVILLIYWHAAMLHFIKKIQHHAKEENPQNQREVYREWVKR